MPTLAELELLHGSMRDLGNSFYRNRVLGQQASERDLDRKMREDEMGLRREDQQDARTNRKASLDAQMAHQQRMEGWQSKLAEARTQEDKLRMFKEILPQADDATRDKIGQALSEAFGVPVKLLPPEKPQQSYDEDPVTGHRTTRLGNTLLNSGTNPAKIPAKEPPGAVENEEYDAEGNLVKRTRRGPLGSLNPAGTGGAAGPSVDENDLGVMESPGASGGGRVRTKMGLMGGPASRASFVDDAMGEIASGQAAPAWGPPPTAPAVPAVRPAAGAPPKPPGKTDAQILREAAAALEANPAVADAIRARLKAWGLTP